MKLLLLIPLLLFPMITHAQDPEPLKESLPKFSAENNPQSLSALWAGWNPVGEPLDVEILHEWEQDDVVLQVLRYRVGVFKGKKAMMAAVYGYPKEGSRLPGLINIHGGGQYADSNAVLTNAKRGYATISVAWAGRINSPEYRVSPNEVQLFWDGKTEDPNYKVTTDWGNLDAYHAPSKNGVDAFASLPTESWTIDDFESGRNSSWFPITMATRRAITFLQEQSKVVDKNRIGVYGHSMGGKLTILTAGTDWRITAAVPSCGGVSDTDNDNELHQLTVGDGPYLENLSCPTLFLNPVNDFHARFQDFADLPETIKCREWRYSFAPHLSHVDVPEHEVATQMWFDHFLKFKYRTPKTPQTELTLSTDTGVPSLSVLPDASQPIVSVDVYYTQEGVLGESRKVRDRVNRSWQHARPTQDFGKWSASLPLGDTEKPLWVYANITYALPEAVSGAGYYYGNYTTETFTLSSQPILITAEELKSAGSAETLTPSLTIENFRGDWQKEWYARGSHAWKLSTHKVNSPLYAAPENAKLALELTSESPNALVIEVDGHYKEISLEGSPEVQSFTFSPQDFTNADSDALTTFTDIHTIGFSDSQHLRSKKNKEAKAQVIGKNWTGGDPVFKKLYWETGSSATAGAGASTGNTETAAGDYTWTTDHMHIGVRWQPHSGMTELNEADFQRDILSVDSSYVQFWVSWNAIEPSEDHLDYQANPASELLNIEHAVNLCNSAGKKVEFVFFHCPKWATVNGQGGGHMPREGIYPEFVKRISTYFKGRVHAYQLYHEANLDDMMQGASAEFLISEMFKKGGSAVREAYGDTPVMVSTSGMSPCIFCPTLEGLDGMGDGPINQFYDMIIADDELMGQVDALNMNVADQNDGYGGMNGKYISATWDNYTLVREKLDAAGYTHIPVISSESWITWDDGANNTYDVNRDGIKNEEDAYLKCLAIMGNCLEKGLNTMNFPWSDNSSQWAMGLTKRIDYNGEVFQKDPSLTHPSTDGGPDVITQKLGISKDEDGLLIKPGGGDIFTVEDYAVPGDPNHLHYYIWRWFSQLSGGSDEVIRHAIAGEKGNDISVGGPAYSGSERYRISSYNRTKKEFKVLLYGNGCSGTGWSMFSLPATIQTGKHYHTGKSKIDFRGEGLEDGTAFTALIETKDICKKTGRDLNYTSSESGGTVKDGEFYFTMGGLQPFTTITIRAKGGE